MTRRSVLIVTHTGRRAAVAAARELVVRLQDAGIGVRALAGEVAALRCDGVDVVEPVPEAVTGVELVLALGGDGTFLRAAELARPAGAPLLGVNFGHVGFLAEVDRADGLDLTSDRIVTRSYDVEERLTIDVSVSRASEVVTRNWALNDVTVEKASRERMLDVIVEVDGRPLSRWGGDGVVCATPTGSTAYAFSAGGPIVWPSVQALLVVPISAHALFARPLVVAPDARIAIEAAPERGDAVMFCDGRRTFDIDPRDRIEIVRGALPVRLVRLRAAPFADRLVDRFKLPVRGWRGPVDDDHAD